MRVVRYAMFGLTAMVGLQSVVSRLLPSVTPAATIPVQAISFIAFHVVIIRMVTVRLARYSALLRFKYALISASILWAFYGIGVSQFVLYVRHAGTQISVFTHLKVVAEFLFFSSPVMLSPFAIEGLVRLSKKYPDPQIVAPVRGWITKRRVRYAMLATVLAWPILSLVMANANYYSDVKNGKIMELSGGIVVDNVYKLVYVPSSEAFVARLLANGVVALIFCSFWLVVEAFVIFVMKDDKG